VGKGRRLIEEKGGGNPCLSGSPGACSCGGLKKKVGPKMVESLMRWHSNSCGVGTKSRVYPFPREKGRVQSANFIIGGLWGGREILTRKGCDRCERWS